MRELIFSDEISKALYYNESNFIDQPSLEDPVILRYNNIYPYRKVPKVDETMKTYITTRCGNFKNVDNTFKSGLITFYVFTHVDLMPTDYGFLRVDYIINKIDELFNKTRDFGIGKLEFDGMDEFDINENYSGTWIRYKVMNFN
jgi:hypothetical protein